ncbi:MAG: right-handed parallel beta-helix repeat-containing protein [bacterium]
MPIELHISPNGDDNNSGSQSFPLATLQGTRNYLRKLTHDNAIVTLHAGTYHLDESLALDEKDCNIVFRAGDGENVCITGGQRIGAGDFTPVTDPDILTRLTPEAQKNILQVDLLKVGITDFGTFTSRGFSRKTLPAHLELFFNDQPMIVAQWPNAGEFTTITGYTKPMSSEWKTESGDLTGGFTYAGDRPKNWAPSDNIWVHGYWAYDWANSYEHVRTLDAKNGVVEADGGLYYYNKGQRFYFLNVLEELNQPGEYYVDTTSGILYFWPPAKLDGADIMISGMADSFITLNNASNVEFHNLTLEGGRGTGITVIGGSDVNISGCTIRNMGNWAISVTGGTGHTVAGCDIYGTGDGGIEINGGDRKTLTTCNHIVQNNHIHHFARWSRCYCAGVNTNGVGIRIANNLIHDAPHNAILFWGNDFTIENNEIYRVCLETGDAGAIYTGRDYTFRGNVIRRNFVHHMGGVGMGSMAIYMDDCVSGTHIVDNILQDCMYGIMLGGGRDYMIENNIFVDCHPAIAPDARGLDENPVWQNMVNNTMRKSCEAMNYLQPPYSERYPEIADVEKYFIAGKGVPPENNCIERNICSGGVWIGDEWHKDKGEKAVYKDNLVSENPGFTDPDFGIFTLTPDSPAFGLGFKQIAIDDIGLQIDENRKYLPPHIRASLQLKTENPVIGEPVKLLLKLRNDGENAAFGTVFIDGYERMKFALRPAEMQSYEIVVIPEKEMLTVNVYSPDSWMHPAKLEVKIN